MSESPAASWRVAAGETGGRLDRALAARLELPRNQIERWIADGRVAIDGVVTTKGSARLEADALVTWTPPPPREESLVPEAGELKIVHEDASLLVLDKPAGLVVHPGAGRTGGTLVHRLLDRFPELSGVGGPGRPGIVHRLDRGTSGLLVVARTSAAYAALTRAFAERAVEKTYLAIVRGTPREEIGEIDAPIGRHRTERKRMAISSRGRPARTSWKRRASARGVSLLELRLHTGRTHQIRVHLRHAGLPLVGDPVYGKDPALSKTGIARPALHAWKLALEHPDSGARVRFVAPVPADLRELWTKLAGADWPS